MMRKKAVAMMLAILMAVCGLPESVWANEANIDERENFWEDEEEEEADENGFVIVDGVLKKYLGDATEIVIPEGVTSIGVCAFSGCSSLTSVIIPEGVTSIGVCAFSGCSSLTSVTIPGSVTSIGEQAFHGCGSITGVIIPEGVTEIGYEAFVYCSNLTNVGIPESVTSIGEDAFGGTEWLKNKRVENPLVIVNHILIDVDSSVDEVSIPEGVTSIGECAFVNCFHLTIYCYAGSYAETYAKEYEIPYQIIGSEDEEPSESPSVEPSEMPSESPDVEPSEMPSESPDVEPSEMPSESPSVEPSEIPSETPSEESSEFPSGKPIVSMDSVTAYTGESVRIPVKISGNKGIMYFDITIRCDPKKLKMVSVDAGELLSDEYGNVSMVETEEEGVFCVSWNVLEEVKKDGCLFYLNFEALGSEGNTGIVLESPYGWDEQYEDVDFVCKSCVVSIKDKQQESQKPQNPQNPQEPQNPIPSKPQNPNDQQPNIPGNQQEQNQENKIQKPARVKISDLKRKGTNNLQVKWKKIKGASGYQIQYALNKKFTRGKKNKKVGKTKTSYMIKKLKSEKKYFVRIRAYKISGGVKKYGKWSVIKNGMVERKAEEI